MAVDLLILRRISEIRLLQSGINLSAIKEMSEEEVMEYLSILDIMSELQQEAMEKTNAR